MSEDNSWGNLIDEVLLFSNNKELCNNSEVNCEVDINENKDIINNSINQHGEKGHEDAPANKGIKGMASEITYEWEPM